ncbi:hypothetical protein [Chengkuizengella sediminis]|uniref:hypothetical protein n=1 Tax=Chengkuizengella sediminis TaxID=1885917 RepID=UPI001389D09F|nr:hypothetical protein [Chengkuizengella sediminis]
MTDSKNFTVDHFIPVSWGHGGLTIRNVYPLNASLNSCKRHKNPFVWFEENRDKIDEERWNELIFYIAVQNDLMVEELREFTFWCEANKRSIKQVKADQRDSKERFGWKRHNSYDSYNTFP